MRMRESTVSLCDIKNKDYDEMTPFGKARMSVFSSVSNKMQQSVKVKLEDTGTSSSEEEENVGKVKIGERSPQKRIVKVIGVKPEVEIGKRSSEKRIVKVIGVKPEKTDSSDEENMSDVDYKSNEDTYKSRRNNIMKNGPEIIKREQSAEISEYEKMIERNRAERLAFIESLKLNEAKAGLVEAVEKATKRKVQPVKRHYNMVEKVSPPVIRKSRRLANLNMDLSEDALFIKAITQAKETEKIKSLPPELSFKEALQFEELYESYVKDINIVEPKEESKFVTYDKSVIQKLTPDVSNIAKVTPVRITALAWYPSAENLIVAAGSKYGDVGIWNVDSESSPYVMKPHLEGITKLHFNPLNRVQLVSSSYDGTLRCGDLVKHLFTEVYNVSDNTCCTWFDFLSESTYLVAQKNGQVALVDSRSAKKRCEKHHTCHDSSLKTVNVHPVNRNNFMTAENKGCIRIWDLRKLQQQPVAEITHHKRCAHAAYFSPVTGNSILTTSTDDTICIFDSTHLTADIKLKQIMKHNNCTGRWLSVFRATWLPNSDDTFVIGSMQEPRRIQVYNKNMDVVHVIMHDNFTTVSSTNVFHPFRPALAGGNSSGKVFVFT